MDSTLFTENPEGFNSPSGDTEPLIAPAPSIEDSLGKVVASLREDFASLRKMVASLPADAEHRKGLVTEAKRIGRRIADVQAILDRRHWLDEGEEEAEG